MGTQEIALGLAHEARKLDCTEITVLERSGITAVNMCGVIACQSTKLSERGLPEVNALVAEDVFGDLHLHRHSGNRFGIMIAKHVRENRGGSFNPEKLIPNVKIGIAIAAIGFLENFVELAALRNPMELTINNTSTSFHHGIDNHTVTTHRTGWQLQLNPEKCGDLTAEVLFKLQPGETVRTE